MTTTCKSIKGTKTELALVQAFIAESTAYTRYTFYAQQATKESYFPVAEVFNDTADNELHHAKIFYKYLENNPVNLNLAPTNPGIIGDTVANLKQAIQSEEEEGVVEYTEAAKVAREEGFDDIADHFEAIATVENHHKERFARFLQMVTDGTLWKRDHEVTWHCLVCGYDYVGTEPPTKCPACNHPYQHYICREDFED